MLGILPAIVVAILFAMSHARAVWPVDPAPVIVEPILLPYRVTGVEAYEPGQMGEHVDLPAPVAAIPPKPVAEKPKPKHVALVREASRWVGAGPAKLGVRRSLWCAAGVNKFLSNIGVRGTGSDLAISFKRWGKPSKPVVGAVAIKHRRGGSGHVVVVKAILPRGKLLAVSPNGGGGKVRLTTYRVAQFHTFRVPQ